MPSNTTQDPVLKKITILQHSPIVKSLALYALLKKMHIEFNLCSFNPQLHQQGWTLPTENTPLILLGGPQSIYEQKKYPWLLEEFEYVKKSLDAGHPSLGICLGGQILSYILGAEVKPCSVPEVGWYPIKISSHAKCLGLEAGEKTFFQWHFDSFEIPQGAQILFEGTGSCKSQGYVWNDKILSIQFHPEMTFEGASLLRENFVVPEGTSLFHSSCLKTEFDSHAVQAHSVLEKMLLWLKDRCK